MSSPQTKAPIIRKGKWMSHHGKWSPARIQPSIHWYHHRKPIKLKAISKNAIDQADKKIILKKFENDH
jgi:hypothetical protein